MPADLTTDVNIKPMRSSDAQAIPLTLENAHHSVICKESNCGTYPKYMFMLDANRNAVSCKKTRLEECVKKQWKNWEHFDEQAGNARNKIIANLQEGLDDWIASLSTIVKVPKKVKEDLQIQIKNFTMPKAKARLPSTKSTSHDVPTTAILQYVSDAECLKQEWQCLKSTPIYCPRAQCSAQRCRKCKVMRSECMFLRNNSSFGDLCILCSTYHEVADAWKGKGDFERLRRLSVKEAVKQVREDVEVLINEWRRRAETYHKNSFSEKFWAPVLRGVESGSERLVKIWLKVCSANSKYARSESMSDLHDGSSVSSEENLARICAQSQAQLPTCPTATYVQPSLYQVAGDLHLATAGHETGPTSGKRDASDTSATHDTNTCTVPSLKLRLNPPTSSFADGNRPPSSRATSPPASTFPPNPYAPETLRSTSVQRASEKRMLQQTPSSNRPAKTRCLEWGSSDTEKQAAVAQQAWLDQQEQRRVHQEQRDKVQEELDEAKRRVKDKEQELEQATALCQATSEETDLARARFKAKVEAVTKERVADIDEQVKQFREQKIEESEISWLKGLGLEE